MQRDHQFRTPIKKKTQEIKEHQSSFKKIIQSLSPIDRQDNPLRNYSYEIVSENKMRRFQTPQRQQMFTDMFYSNAKQSNFEPNKSQQIQFILFNQKEQISRSNDHQPLKINQNLQQSNNLKRTISKIKLQDRHFKTPKPLSSCFKKYIKQSDTLHKKNQKIAECNCNCKKSRCLKLYCDCFASGNFCSGCNCNQCLNTHQNPEIRYSAMISIMQRNPLAFKPKVESNVQKQGKHYKGCNCKMSKCLKGYCQCYQAGILCSEICKCQQCHNNETSKIQQRRKKRKIEI